MQPGARPIADETFHEEDKGVERFNSDLKRFHPSSALLTFVSYTLVMFMSLWGTLARLGLTWLGQFASAQVFPVIWCQIVGCFVMGLNIDRKAEIEEFFPPLFPAIGTGFCGSTTTFSTWLFAVFIAFVNRGETPTSRFGSFFSGLALTLVTPACAFGALQCGSHLSKALPRVPKLTSSPLSYALAYLSIFLGIGSYLAVIFVLAFGPKSWRHKTSFALVFAPPAALLRFELAKRLNGRNKTFPVGTFAANIIAVVVLSTASILVYGGVAHPTYTQCSALRGGMEDGFTATLSTVSTFVVELRTLDTLHAYRYFSISWIVSQCIFIAVLGSWLWSGDRVAQCG